MDGKVRCSKCHRLAEDLSAHQCHQTSKRAIVCEICGKRFKRQYTFRLHQRTHSDQKQHKCQVCTAAFHQKYNLLNHMKLHSPGSRPPPQKVAKVKEPKIAVLDEKRAKEILDKAGLQNVLGSPKQTLSSIVTNSVNIDSVTGMASPLLESRMHIIKHDHNTVMSNTSFDSGSSNLLNTNNARSPIRPTSTLTSPEKSVVNGTFTDYPKVDHNTATILKYLQESPESSKQSNTKVTKTVRTQSRHSLAFSDGSDRVELENAVNSITSLDPQAKSKSYSSNIRYSIYKDDLSIKARQTIPITTSSAGIVVKETILSSSNPSLELRPHTQGLNDTFMRGSGLAKERDEDQEFRKRELKKKEDKVRENLIYLINLVTEQRTQRVKVRNLLAVNEAEKQLRKCIQSHARMQALVNPKKHNGVSNNIENSRNVLRDVLQKQREACIKQNDTYLTTSRDVPENVLHENHANSSFSVAHTVSSSVPRISETLSSNIGELSSTDQSKRTVVMNLQNDAYRTCTGNSLTRFSLPTNTKQTLRYTVNSLGGWSTLLTAQNKSSHLAKDRESGHITLDKNLVPISSASLVNFPPNVAQQIDSFSGRPVSQSNKRPLREILPKPTPVILIPGAPMAVGGGTRLVANGSNGMSVTMVTQAAPRLALARGGEAGSLQNLSPTESSLEKGVKRVRSANIPILPKPVLFDPKLLSQQTKSLINDSSTVVSKSSDVENEDVAKALELARRYPECEGPPRVRDTTKGTALQNAISSVLHLNSQKTRNSQTVLKMAESTDNVRQLQTDAFVVTSIDSSSLSLCTSGLSFSFAQSSPEVVMANSGDTFPQIIVTTGADFCDNELVFNTSGSAHNELENFTVVPSCIDSSLTENVMNVAISSASTSRTTEDDLGQYSHIVNTSSDGISGFDNDSVLPEKTELENRMDFVLSSANNAKFKESSAPFQLHKTRDSSFLTADDSLSFEFLNSSDSKDKHDLLRMTPIDKYYTDAHHKYHPMSEIALDTADKFAHTLQDIHSSGREQFSFGKAFFETAHEHESPMGKCLEERHLMKTPDHHSFMNLGILRRQFTPEPHMAAHGENHSANSSFSFERHGNEGEEALADKHSAHSYEVELEKSSANTSAEEGDIRRYEPSPVNGLDIESNLSSASHGELLEILHSLLRDPRQTSPGFGCSRVILSPVKGLGATELTDLASAINLSNVFASAGGSTETSPHKLVPGSTDCSPDCQDQPERKRLKSSSSVLQAEKSATLVDSTTNVFCLGQVLSPTNAECKTGNDCTHVERKLFQCFGEGREEMGHVDLQTSGCGGISASLNLQQGDKRRLIYSTDTEVMNKACVSPGIHDTAVSQPTVRALQNSGLEDEQLSVEKLQTANLLSDNIGQRQVTIPTENVVTSTHISDLKNCHLDKTRAESPIVYEHSETLPPNSNVGDVNLVSDKREYADLDEVVRPLVVNGPELFDENTMDKIIRVVEDLRALSNENNDSSGQ